MLFENRELSKIALKVIQAFQDQQFVKIKVINETNNHQIIGIITKIDQVTRRIKLSHDRGIDWLPFDDILNVEPVN
ncbi:YolD-like protein [Paenibacillus sp. yr247]|nr:YolD-like protein [Paenibacillus sp. yr247]